LGKLSLRDSDSEQPEEEPTKVKQCGTKLDVALIDYTLSRAVCGNGEDKDVSVEFAPLDDDALFTGKGDNILAHSYLQSIIITNIVIYTQVTTNSTSTALCVTTSALALQNLPRNG